MLCVTEHWGSNHNADRAVDLAGFPPRLPGFKPEPGHVGFVVDKVTPEQIFSKYFCFA
jgi:hypothetical protein